MSSRVRTQNSAEPRKQSKSAIKGGSSTKQEKQKYVRLEQVARPIDEYVFSIPDIWNAPKVPRPVLRELIREVTQDILNRGLKTPFLLFPFRTYNNESRVKDENGIPIEGEDVRAVIEQVFLPERKRPVSGEALVRIIRSVDIYTLAGVLKWCWSRLPGGIVTWEVYKKFKDEERKLMDSKVQVPLDTFQTLMPSLMESNSHFEIMCDFFKLLTRVASKEKYNYMSGKKIVRLCGIWAFDIEKPRNDASEFAEGISCWSVAAEACYHLFIAFLRNLWPNPADMNTNYTYLDRSLERILESELTYPPPKTIYMTRAVTVPKITLTVGRLSSSPFVLLQRISKVIQFEDRSKFISEDDYTTLYYLFYDINQIENHMSEESRHVLNCISKENSIFTDHKMRIKDTPKLPYDVRCRTWSKAYNHAFIDPISGEPRRPLTNYVYEDHQREMIKNTRLPPGERPPLPYPDTDGDKSRPVQVGSWLNVFDSYRKVVGSNVDIDRWKQDRQISTENLVSCLISNVAIDDYFIWLWMCSLSSEQDEPRKSLFGRSVVIEINLDNTPAGRRWVIVEEVLNPAPPPMEKKVTPADNTPLIVKKAPRTREKTAKKPVRFTSPVVAKAPPIEPRKAPVPPPLQMYPPIYNIDPLVAAVAERLRLHNVDESIQTDVEDKPVPVEPIDKSISADDGNNKGVQTYNTTSIGVGTDNDDTYEVAVGHESVPSFNTDRASQDRLPNIDIGSEASDQEEHKHDLKKSASYEDVMHSIPYVEAGSDDFDYSVTPIVNHAVSAQEPLFIPKMRYAQELEPQDLPPPSNPPPQPSPPLNAEGFVVPIDSSRSRVVSMPVSRLSKSGPYGQHARHPGTFNEFEDADYDYDHSGPFNSSNHGPSNLRIDSSQRKPAGHSRSQSHAPLPAPVFSISASNRETSKNLLQGPPNIPSSTSSQNSLPEPAQPLDRGLFDRSVSDISDDSNHTPVNNNMFRLNPPASGSNDSYQSNINAPFAYGNEKFQRYPNNNSNATNDVLNSSDTGPYGAAGVINDPRDPRTKPSASVAPTKEASRVPRDFQNSELHRPFPKQGHSSGPPDARAFSRSMDNFGKPPQRFGGKLNRLGTGGGGIPSIDDMMFDMGPMRAGAGAARPKGLFGSSRQFNQAQNNSPYGSSNLAHQSKSSTAVPAIPKKYPYNPHESDVDYGSDTGYRYDPHGKDKATPDSMLDTSRRHLKTKSLGEDSLAGPGPMGSAGVNSRDRFSQPGPLFTKPRDDSPSAAPLTDFVRSGTKLDIGSPYDIITPKPHVASRGGISGSRPINLPYINDMSGPMKTIPNNGVNSNTIAASTVSSPEPRANSVSASFISKSTFSDDMIPRSTFSHEFGAPQNTPPLPQVEESKLSSTYNYPQGHHDTLEGHSFNTSPSDSTTSHQPHLMQMGASQSTVTAPIPISEGRNSSRPLALPALEDIDKALEAHDSSLPRNSDSVLLHPPSRSRAQDSDGSRPSSFVTGDHVKTIAIPKMNDVYSDSTHQFRSNELEPYDSSEGHERIEASELLARQGMPKPEDVMKNINPLRILKENVSKRKSRHSTGGEFISAPWQSRAGGGQRSVSTGNIGQSSSYGSGRDPRDHQSHDLFEGFDYSNDEHIARAMPMLVPARSNSSDYDDQESLGRMSVDFPETSAQLFPDEEIAKREKIKDLQREASDVRRKHRFSQQNYAHDYNNNWQSAGNSSQKVSRFSIQGLLNSASKKGKK